MPQAFLALAILFHSKVCSASSQRYPKCLNGCLILVIPAQVFGGLPANLGLWVPQVRPCPNVSLPLHVISMALCCCCVEKVSLRQLLHCRFLSSVLCWDDMLLKFMKSIDPLVVHLPPDPSSRSPFENLLSHSTAWLEDQNGDALLPPWMSGLPACTTADSVWPQARQRIQLYSIDNALSWQLLRVWRHAGLCVTALHCPALHTIICCHPALALDQVRALIVATELYSGSRSRKGYKHHHVIWKQCQIDAHGRRGGAWLQHLPDPTSFLS